MKSKSIPTIKIVQRLLLPKEKTDWQKFVQWIKEKLT